MCHHIKDRGELAESDREGVPETPSREALEAQLDREKFAALGLVV